MSDPIQKIKVRNLLRFDTLGNWNDSTKPILVGEPVIAHDTVEKCLKLTIGRDTNIQNNNYNYDSQNNYNALNAEQYTFFSGRGAGYNLPIAGSSLGGVRIKPQLGSNENTSYSCIKIEGSGENEGVISVNKENLANYFIATSNLKNQAGGDSVQHIATNLLIGDSELCNDFYDTSSVHSTLGIGGQLVVCTNPLTPESITNKNAGRNIIQGDLYVDGTITSLLHTEQHIIEDDYIILRSGNENALANNALSGIKILNGSNEHENLGIVMDNRGFLFTTKESNNQNLYRHAWMRNNILPTDLNTGINILDPTYTEIAYIGSNNNSITLQNIRFNRFGGNIQIFFNAFTSNNLNMVEVCQDTVGNLFIGAQQDTEDSTKSDIVVRLGTFEQRFTIATSELIDINNPVELYISRLNDNTIGHIYINNTTVFNNEEFLNTITGNIGTLVSENDNYLQFFGDGLSYIHNAKIYCYGEKIFIPCRLTADQTIFGFYDINSNTFYSKGDEDFIRGYDKIGSYTNNTSQFLKYENSVFATPSTIRYSDIIGNLPTTALPTITADKLPSIPFSKIEKPLRMLNIEYGKPNITVASLDWPTNSQTSVPTLTIPRALDDLDGIDDSNYIISNAQNYRMTNSITKVEMSDTINAIEYEERINPNNTSENDKVVKLPVFKINNKPLNQDINITMNDIAGNFTPPEPSINVQRLGCLQPHETLETISNLEVDQYGRVKSYTKNYYSGSEGIACFIVNNALTLKMESDKTIDPLMITFSKPVTELEYSYLNLPEGVTLTPTEKSVVNGLLYTIIFELPVNVNYNSLPNTLCTVTVTGIDSYNQESNSVNIMIKK